MSIPEANHVGGMLAQRWALVAHLGALSDDEWTGCRDEVARVVALYGTVLGESGPAPAPDRAALVEELDRRADLVEGRLAGVGEDRWHMTVEGFEAVGGTAQMAVHRLMAELVLLALRAGAPVPPPAREAAAAAVAWRVGENVEVPARVVLDGDRELILGGGEPEIVVQADTMSFLCAAFGVERDGACLHIEGPPDRADAFRKTFVGAWHAFDRDADDLDPA